MTCTRHCIVRRKGIKCYSELIYRIFRFLKSGLTYFGCVNMAHRIVARIAGYLACLAFLAQAQLYHTALLPLAGFSNNVAGVFIAVMLLAYS